MPKPRRRWFSYSLRTFFVVLTVFGIWLGVQVKWIRARADARRWIEAHKGPPSEIAPRSQFKWFPWSLKVLGEQPVDRIDVTVPPYDRQYADRLGELFPEAAVYVVAKPGP